MLLENMFMALHAIKANKMRSFLTMLGIIIGIGSVIAIVSIGDTMRSMVADLYANVGMTRAIIYIWPSDGGDMRDSDYFNLEQMERIKEVFHDDIEYMDTNAYYSSEALFGRKKVKFQFQGIDYNYPDVQKINILYGRNLNEADIKGRKKNVVLEVQGALELFGTENAVGKTLRTTVYGETDDYNVVGVYKKEMTPFEAMMMSMMPGQTKEGFIPYTILSWPNDYLYQLNFYAKEGTDMNELSGRMVPYLARLKDRQPADVTFYSALDEMKGNDSMMSSRCRRDSSHFSAGWRNRNHEYHAGVRNGKNQRNRNQKGPWGEDAGCYDTVFDGIRDSVRIGRHSRRGDRRGAGRGRRRDVRDFRGSEAPGRRRGGWIFRSGRPVLWPVSGVKGGEKRPYRRAAVRIKDFGIMKKYVYVAGDFPVFYRGIPGFELYKIIKISRWVSPSKKFYAIIR